MQRRLAIDAQMQRLQLAQNAAARLVSGVRRRDHITRQFYAQPLLAAVRQRVILKIAVLAEITRPWLCSVLYILELCIPVDSVLARPRFRSASTGSIEKYECRTSTGQRTTHSGRRISLPPDRPPERQQAVNERFFSIQTEQEFSSC